MAEWKFDPVMVDMVREKFIFANRDIAAEFLVRCEDFINEDLLESQIKLEEGDDYLFIPLTVHTDAKVAFDKFREQQ